MALTKSAQQGFASATVTAGTPSNGTAFDIGYGVSGVGQVTNGGTGPTIACDFVLQVSSDGGTTWFDWSRQTAGTTASAVYRFPFALGIGAGGDFGKWRPSFQNNTAQNVTGQCDAESTTAL